MKNPSPWPLPQLMPDVQAENVKTVAATGTKVTISGETRTAGEWAELRGLKWQTVKMRRMRGDSWRDALNPELRITRWNDRRDMAEYRAG